MGNYFGRLHCQKQDSSNKACLAVQGIFPVIKIGFALGLTEAEKWVRSGFRWVKRNKEVARLRARRRAAVISEMADSKMDVTRPGQGWDKRRCW